ncbi:MAG: hypothetical protein PHR56_05910 [Dehalococcoidales bacterium]|nr:hypothetical protein [Dehalococcoidales bacterium]
MEDHEPQPQKRKAVSILLAIFLGPLTWAYTFKRDSWKLALGLGINANIFILILLMFILNAKTAEMFKLRGEFYDGGIALVFPLGVFAITLSIAWLCAVIDSILKFIRNNSLVPLQKDERAAALIALFAGPWTWIYTYKKDWWKFWSALVAIYAVPITLSILGEGLLIMYTPFGWLIIWIISIMHVLLKMLDRNSEFNTKGTTS